MSSFRTADTCIKWLLTYRTLFHAVTQSTKLFSCKRMLLDPDFIIMDKIFSYLVLSQIVH